MSGVRSSKENWALSEACQLPSLDTIHTLAFDFDGVFTDNKVWVDDQGSESVRCDRADGLALDMLRTAQLRGLLEIETFIISSEESAVVAHRARKLRIDCHQGIGNKLAFMQQHLEERFPTDPDPFAGLVFLGNDLNDLTLMQAAGFSVAPSDADRRVLGVASLILDRPGGDGFVRMFVECMLGIHKLNSDEIDEFVSNR